MGHKEEIIIRGAVGIIIGLGINAFLASLGKDVISPLIKQQSFDDLEKRLVVTVGGIKIHYGELIENFIYMFVVVASVYATLHYMEKYKIL